MDDVDPFPARFAPARDYMDELKISAHQAQLLYAEQQRLHQLEMQRAEEARIKANLDAAEAEARRKEDEEQKLQKLCTETFERGRSLNPRLERERSEVNDFFPGYHLTQVEHNCQEYAAIAIPFLTGDMTILSVELIENPTLRANFDAGLKRMHGRSSNILFLYHTSKGRPEEICEDGLLMSTATGGSFGRGLYFADDPLKSNEYWMVGRVVAPDGPRVMFVFAVIMGCVQRFGDGMTATHLKKCPAGFDSVAGRVPRAHGLHNEYVVYRENQVLPRYVIRYSMDKPTESDWEKVKIPTVPMIDGPFSPVSIEQEIALGEMMGDSESCLIDDAPESLCMSHPFLEAHALKSEPVVASVFVDDVPLLGVAAAPADLPPSVGLVAGARNFLLKSESVVAMDVQHASSFAHSTASPRTADQSQALLSSPTRGTKHGLASKHESEPPAKRRRVSLTVETSGPSFSLSSAPNFFDMPSFAPSRATSPPTPKTARFTSPTTPSVAFCAPAPLVSPRGMSENSIESIFTPKVDCMDGLLWVPPTPTFAGGLGSLLENHPGCRFFRIVTDELKRTGICAICQVGMGGLCPKTVCELVSCGHVFHVECVTQIPSYKDLWLQCPTCKAYYGTRTGDQPDGTMDVQHYPAGTHDVQGLDTGVFQIKYIFPDGVQGPKHVKPGKPYFGTSRVAFIPDTQEGMLVLSRLEVAWQRKLIFSVGTSMTTGRTDTVVWNIHHKTSKFGGEFGFPDQGAMRRILAELRDLGVSSQ